MNIGPHKLQAATGLAVLAVVAVASHLLAGVTGLLVVVLLVQVATVLAVLEVRVRLPREVRRAVGRQPVADPAERQRALEEHRRAVEDLLQRHSEGHAQALREAVLRLEAAIADTSPPDRTR